MRKNRPPAEHSSEKSQGDIQRMPPSVRVNQNDTKNNAGDPERDTLIRPAPEETVYAD
jgi:hypothetical protein